ncbi:hypothetical protein [Actinacidiphila sp. ITFR-21]|uniref:hypothetical protein n=1 Tax=Actinacidiphila sp. ITFR-21 TaxID=3075199 RepID=UPI00288B1805|nr:hypothetical protein [Streptomyces sp. ITFR-21]WNI18092.1 hypothetical protein RLT57_22790 [Streptomyces sp. ITFR-21]
MEARERYADRRPYVLPETLGDLMGPASGHALLPTALDWSQQTHYDLSVDKDRRRLYETVIREACDPADLRRFLNAGLLQCLWPTLWLPARLKAAWEDRFPELRRPASGRTPPGRPRTKAEATVPPL